MMNAMSISETVGSFDIFQSTTECIYQEYQMEGNNDHHEQSKAVNDCNQKYLAKQVRIKEQKTHLGTPVDTRQCL